MIDGSRKIWDIIQGHLLETEMQFYTVLIGEDVARELLAHNKEPESGKDSTNRKASALRVASYEAMMASGEWLLSPQPLVFSAANANGNEDMTDGQHRLKALLAMCKKFPGFELPFTVALNVPTDVRWVIDTGNAKKPVDFLRMSGEAYANLLGPALKMLYAYDEVPFKSIALWRAVRLSPTAQNAFRDRHTGLRSGLRLAMDLKTLAMPYVVTVIYYLLAREHGAEKAVQFLNGLEKGLVPEATTDGAVWKLREYLSQQKRLKYRWDGFEQLGLLIFAANDWLMGGKAFVPSQLHRQLVVSSARKNAAQRFPTLVSRAEVEEAPTLL